MHITIPTGRHESVQEYENFSLKSNGLCVQRVNNCIDIFLRWEVILRSDSEDCKNSSWHEEIRSNRYLLAKFTCLMYSQKLVLRVFNGQSVTPSCTGFCLHPSLLLQLLLLWALIYMVRIIGSSWYFYSRA